MSVIHHLFTLLFANQLTCLDVFREAVILIINIYYKTTLLPDAAYNFYL